MMELMALEAPALVTEDVLEVRLVQELVVAVVQLQGLPALELVR